MSNAIFLAGIVVACWGRVREQCEPRKWVNNLRSIATEIHKGFVNTLEGALVHGVQFCSVYLLKMALILQIAYYPGLLQARQIMLEQAGHKVISALGNDQGMALATTHSFSLVLVGFSAPESVRRTMIRWLKQHLPQTQVVALLANESECLPDADCETLSENPGVWLNAVAELARASAPGGQ